MKNKLIIFVFGIFLIAGVFGASVFSGGTSTSFNNPVSGGFSSTTNTWKYTPSSYDTLYSSTDIANYWPILSAMSEGDCEASQDFLIGIPPGGCEPTVVRSDLLEEQNVPVFCKLDAVKVNPLIKVSSIKSISFKGDYPQGVVGVSYHPAQAAIKSYDTILGNPVINNIGYVVIILERNKVEDDMLDEVTGNLTATIYYDTDEAYGVGESEFYLPVMSDADWDNSYTENSFWNGRGYVRASEVGDDYAKIELYTDKDNEFTTVTLNEGEESKEFYFPGYYCKASLKVKLNKITSPKDSAKLIVDGSEIWVQAGSTFLNGKCRVNDVLALADGSGSVDVTCSGSSKKILTLSTFGGKFNIDGSDTKLSIGDEVATGKITGDKIEQQWYVGYIGNVPETVADKTLANKDLAVLVSYSSPLSTSDFATIAKNIGLATRYNDVSLKTLTAAASQKTGILSKDFKVKLLVVDSSIGNSVDIGTTKVIFNGRDTNVENKEINNVVFQEYYDLMNNSIYDLVDEYGSEKLDNGETMGEIALLREIEIAQSAGQQKIAQELRQLFMDRYTESKSYAKVSDDYYKSTYYNIENSQTAFYINSASHQVGVSQFKAVGSDEKKATILIGSISQSVVEGQQVLIGTTTNGAEKIVIDEIEPNEISFNYYDIKGKNTDSYSVKVGNGTQVGDKIITLRSTDVKEVAYVSLIPTVKNTKTEANFTFNIGIEKRAIELSPEKTEEMVENLNKTIEDWSNLVDKLGEVIKVWKGACFATSAVLNFKAMADGFSGESLARKAVMEQYNSKCDIEHKDITKEKCYTLLSDEIDASTKQLAEVYKTANSQIDGVLNQYSTKGDGIFTDKAITNPTEYLAKLKEAAGINKDWTQKITTSSTGEVTLTASSITSSEQIRNIMAYQNAVKSGADKTVIDALQKEMNNSLVSAALVQSASDVKKDIGLTLTTNNLNSIEKEIGVGKLGEVDLTKLNAKNPTYQFTKNDVITSVTFGSKNYLLNMTKKSGSATSYTVGNVYEIGTDATLTPIDEKKTTQIKNTKDGKMEDVSIVTALKSNYAYSLSTCSGNKIKNPKIRYYVSGDQKGMPAVVPFDVNNGWYIYVAQTSYKDSGDFLSFELCNVGSDGVMQPGQYPSDSCQSVDLNAGTPTMLISCPTLTTKEISTLVTNARAAVKQAQAGYGQSAVSILGTSIEVGDAYSSSTSASCYDFMSPKDCQLLFNVCDPVICPSSRCDLGGKYKVADVVQTGIIGSLLLCLPNAGEVAVPICLTGVHAGIDSFVSILESERDCLQTSLDSGEHVGICDEITSIYLCEFFWRQLSPLIDLLVPEIIKSAYGAQGQSVKGGGEYLTIDAAWDNLDQSINYFKNTYAQNAFQAFEAKNVEEAGSQVCKSFIGTSVPTSADAIESLLEAESPYQVYAWFDSSTYSEATVPATAQYKVYYHIYAGNDVGHYYRVYLKDPPATEYYRTTSSIQVATGYVQVGEQIDETEDFTAPEGYKQLCVDVDGTENCGYKQVSTDFALNYVSDKYVESQVNKTTITTRKECLSGTSSAYALVNPNLQAGVENTINSEIALDGIVRVCATYDPTYTTTTTSGTMTTTATTTGTSSETTTVVAGRWRDVGYCDSAEMRCWLDVQSVADDLKTISAVENTTSIADLDSAYTTASEQMNALYENVAKNLSIIENKLEGLSFDNSDKSRYMVESKIGEIITMTNLILAKGNFEEGFSRQGTNNQQARAAYYKAQVYMEVVNWLLSVGSDSVTTESIIAGNTLSAEELEAIGENIEEGLEALENSIPDATFEILEGGDIIQNEEGSYVVGVIKESEDEDGDIQRLITLKSQSTGATSSIKYPSNMYLSDAGYTLVSS